LSEVVIEDSTSLLTQGNWSLSLAPVFELGAIPLSVIDILLVGVVVLDIQGSETTDSRTRPPSE
jgi:hypothetical protein